MNKYQIIVDDIIDDIKNDISIRRGGFSTGQLIKPAIKLP
jgi:hypothetical protein